MIKGTFEYEVFEKSVFGNGLGEWFKMSQPFEAESLDEITFHQKTVLERTANIRNIKVVFKGNKRSR